MSNLILTGMPGSGKSTLGVVLAKTLGMLFVDTDLLIQEKAQGKLQHIIDTEGIEAFLKLEEEVLKSVDVTNTVIATGGSAIYSDSAMQHLRSIGKVVYIKLSCEEIEKRLNNIKTRGIAMKPGETIRDLYNYRVPMYERYADITLETEGLAIEESIEKLVSLLSK
ncbi:MAG: shikimate kinase [Firmicutes bacterium]|nr:shikimate kinase [Bacillota bacterium]